MVWEFKQQLFISQRRVSPHTVSDLSNPAVRAQLQAHIDSSAHLPPPGAPDEYAALFEAAYPAEADRRTYLDAKMAGAKPSYGHLALATLMRGNLTRLVWTTNFDSLLADACANVYGSTGYLTTVALDAPELAAQLISEGRWPIEIKLHGDFRSRRLKNTDDELRHQDLRLRQVLVESCRRFGLVAVGYSGRDDSVINALEEVLEVDGAYPAGLFWLHRGEHSPLPRVARLLENAVKRGVEAAMVKVENFDEALRDLIRLQQGIDTKVLDSFAADRRRWSPARQPSGRRSWPVVRLNALPIVQMPNLCRRLVCKVGGHTEVLEAVEHAGVDVLVTRTRAGVLTFGADTDLRRAFERYGITAFDLHTIDPKRLRYESGERGLLRAALTRAIERHRGLDAIRRRSTDLLAPSDPNDVEWMPLKSLVGDIGGIVRDYPELRWREGIEIALGWADDRLWLLVNPRIVFEGITESNKAAAADLARERTVKRYNRQLNDLITYWARFLAGDGTELRALGIDDGVEAVFRLSFETGFSWRAQP
jgi:hypothetical protein